MDGVGVRMTSFQNPGHLTLDTWIFTGWRLEVCGFFSPKPTKYFQLRTTTDSRPPDDVSSVRGGGVSGGSDGTLQIASADLSAAICRQIL